MRHGHADGGGDRALLAVVVGDREMDGDWTGAGDAHRHLRRARVGRDRRRGVVEVQANVSAPGEDEDEDTAPEEVSADEALPSSAMSVA